MSMFYFCRDGILRRREWWYNEQTESGAYYDLPMRTYLDHDPNAFLKMIGEDFLMEDGLTVRELFANLKPWANLMEGVACMAFDEFCKEAEKDPTPEDFENFTHIAVNCYVTIDAVPKFEHLPRKRDSKKWHEVFGMGGPLVTDQIEMVVCWDNLAICKEPVWDENAKIFIEGYSVDYSPLTDWAHLPLVISDRMVLRDETARGSDHLSVKQPLLNPDHPWVKRHEHDGRLFALELPMMPGFRTFYNTIVRGCYWDWGFDYSPVMRDTMREEIKESADKLEEWIKQNVPDPDSDIVGPPLDPDYRSAADIKNEFKGNLIRKIMAADPATRVSKPERD